LSLTSSCRGAGFYRVFHKRRDTNQKLLCQRWRNYVVGTYLEYGALGPPLYWVFETAYVQYNTIFLYYNRRQTAAEVTSYK